MIPKILHQVWIGPHPLPQRVHKFRESFRRFCPDWMFKLWTNENMHELPNYNRPTLGLSCTSNILRVEAVRKYGGIYADITDVECLKDLQPLLLNQAFAGRQREQLGNAIFGAVANHSWLTAMSNAWEEYERKPPPWGPSMFTRFAEHHPITIYPQKSFYPWLWDQKFTDEMKAHPDSFMAHYWDVTWGHHHKRIGVFCHSRFVVAKWEKILTCLRSWRDIDDFHIILWDYPPQYVSQVKRINPNWQIVGNERSPAVNRVFNIWYSRTRLLKEFASRTVFTHCLLAEDDMQLFSWENIKKVSDTHGMMVFSKGHVDYAATNSLGWMENGIILSREYVTGVLQDYCEYTVGHDDRFFFLLAYVHGFVVRTKFPEDGPFIEHHCTGEGWTYEEKAPYARYGKYSDLVDPGTNFLNSKGLDVVRALQ